MTTIRCKTHGDNADTVIIFSKSECKACFDKKQAVEDKKQNDDKVYLSRVANSNKIKHYRTIKGIPKRAIDYRLAKLDTKAGNLQTVVKSLSSYVDRFGEMLAKGRCATLLGGVGIGKTHMLCSIVNELVEAGYMAKYITLSDLLSRIRLGWGKVNNSANMVYKEFVKYDFLAIDEVGGELPNKTNQPLLFDLINMRYDEVKPTFMASNLNTGDFAIHVGDRVASRMRDGGGGVFTINAEDYRK